MLKKILCAVLIFTLACAFASCNRGGDDEGGKGEVSRETWDTAFDELINSTNSTLVVAGKSKHYDRENIEDTFCVQKVTPSVIYQSNEYSGKKQQLYLSEIDGVDYIFEKNDGGVWDKREYYDQDVKYSNRSAAEAYNSLRNSYDQLKYDKERGYYYGEEVIISTTAPDGTTASQTLKRVAVAFNGDKLNYVLSDGYIMKRVDNETDYTIVGTSISVIMSTIGDVSALTLPTVGTSDSPDYSESFEELKAKAFDLIDNYFDATAPGTPGTEDGGNDASGDQGGDQGGEGGSTPAVSTNSVTPEVMASAIEELTNASNLTVTYTYVRKSQGLSSESVMKFAGDKQYVYTKNVYEDGRYLGTVEGATIVNEWYWDGLRLDPRYPNSGIYVCDIALVRNQDNEKWTSTASTKDVATSAPGMDILRLMNKLTYNEELGAYVGSNIQMQDEYYSDTFYESLSVSFSGNKVYQIKAVVVSKGEDKYSREYTYTDYGTTTLSRPTDIYGGFTKKEFGEYKEKLWNSNSYSVQYTYTKADGTSVYIREDYSGNVIAIEYGYDNIEYYVSEGLVYRIYKFIDGKEIYVKEAITDRDPPLFAPEINRYKIFALYEELTEACEYDELTNTYVCEGRCVVEGALGGDFYESAYEAENIVVRVAFASANEYGAEMSFTFDTEIDGERVRMTVAIKIYPQLDDGSTNIMLPEVYDKKDFE